MVHLKKILWSLFVVVLFSISFVSPAKCANIPVSWGSNGQGELGDGTNGDSQVPVAVFASGALAGKTITAVSAGYSHSLALTSDSRVYAWGANWTGQLGDDSNDDSNVPVAVNTSGALAGKTITAISAGAFHNLVLTSDGRVYGWGSNNQGQLGSGGSTVSYVPVAVSTSGALAGKKIVAISAGYYHSLALTSDGHVYTWGINGNGDYSNGGLPDSDVPMALGPLGALAGKTITAISAGNYHSLALTSEGRVYAWGFNRYGALGNGNNTDSDVPVAVDTSGALAGKTITAIGVGDSHSLALTSDGRAYTWGYGMYGELGSGAIHVSNVPVAVDTSGVLAGKIITAIDAGDYHSLALTSEGRVYAWGAGGSLGNGRTDDRDVPVAVNTSVVLAGETVTSISAGDFYSLALTSNSLRPTVTIKTPANGSAVSTLPTISVKATDNSGGVGIARVSIYLRRDADAKYWSGTAWGSTRVALTTTLQIGLWTRSAGLPLASTTDSTKLLSEGSYSISATGIDKAGNQKTVSGSFIVDRTAPLAVTVTEPVSGAVVSVLPVIRGTATDNSSGSGISRVDLKFKRGSDGKYWTGTTWGTTTPVVLTTWWSGGVWSRTSDLPSTTTTDATQRLTDGNYTFSATAYDRTGRSKTTSRGLRVDHTIPATATITTPATGTSIKALPSVSGTATDNSGGSGIGNVTFYLKRSDGLYWSGTAWGSTITKLVAALSGTTWSKSSGLPSGTNLHAASYLIGAYISDKAGNVKTVSSSFKVVATVQSNPAAATEECAPSGQPNVASPDESSFTAAVAPVSPVQLSTTSISVPTATVRLVFTGALDISKAIEPASYSVSVNGIEVFVGRAGLVNGTTPELGLVDTLEVGDVVTVHFNLLDSRARRLAGEVSVTAH